MNRVCPECGYQDTVTDWCVFAVGPFHRQFNVTTIYCPNCDWLTFDDWRLAEDEEGDDEPR